MEKQTTPTLSPEQRQAALNAIPAEYLAKIESQLNPGVPVDREWSLMAEFAMLYGWEAYRDAQNDLVSTSEFHTLIQAGRNLKAIERYNKAWDNFFANMAPRTKNPQVQFQKLTKGITKDVKVGDE